MKNTKASQRLAYGNALVELGKERPEIVVLEADLGKSTMSCLFQDAFPDRYFDMGIAEQNMLSTAAGLAVSGKIAFVSTFAVFVTGRAYDQIRQTIAIGKLNVKICGSSSGLSDFGDGSTHQSIEDLAIMGAIPNMTVLTPCDAAETRMAVRFAAEVEGPVYLRVSRNLLTDFEDQKNNRMEKQRILRKGKDIAIFAHGAMVEKAMEAAELLQKEGLDTRVISIAHFKPFDANMAIKLSSGCRAVITAEDHTYIGGLAYTMAFALRNTGIKMDYVAVDDCFGQSAHNEQELMEHYGLTSLAIAKKAKALLK